MIIHIWRYFRHVLINAILWSCNHFMATVILHDTYLLT